MKRGSQIVCKVLRRGADRDMLECACPLLKGQLLGGSDQSLPCRNVGLTLSDFQIFQEKPESGF